MIKLKECNGCQQMRPIYKNKTINGIRYKLCKSCAMQKESKLVLNKTQLKKQSSKKAKLDPLYSKLRKIHLEKHPICQIKTPLCKTNSSEIHHSEYRGVNYLNVSTWFATCRECHKWIHSFPQEAREKGWLK